MKKLIDIPDEILQDLKILAVKENRDLKNFIQDKLIDLVSDGRKKQDNKNKYVKCFDKFEVELKEGDIVAVQLDGEHEIYKKEDGQLYFKPYGKEDRVSAYFSNDIIKVER